MKNFTFNQSPDGHWVDLEHEPTSDNEAAFYADKVSFSVKDAALASELMAVLEKVDMVIVN